ncbi:uncharacterized protein Bfra_006773 [Botrytis fragariae]|uniref:Uncharacterized protein n=1 Tax=Botrytis fragariae TaxID=1964551 RepID=A0A8H6B528_9HELO|nr:uncharacterized protein Bfra_006773 [Botrytis fragariae]KAF5879564.1 hypothetical protein Bfra_006773 [Botrytis fragariae]
MDIEVVQENADGYSLDPELADISESRTFYLPNSSIILHMFARRKFTPVDLNQHWLDWPVEFRQRARVGFERRVGNGELINTETGKVTYLEHICLDFSMRLEPEV